MFKRVFVLFLVGFMAGKAVAQNAVYDCSNGRFVNDLFTADYPSTVTYGFNSIRVFDWSGNTTTENVQLEMDIFQPANDAASHRPLIILAFGGSFIYNNRFQVHNLCQAFARKGYVAAAIDYRKIKNTNANITWHFATQSNLADEVIKVSADMKAAIRYMKHYATNYRIDTTKIFLGGYSSGAIAAIQTAYADSVAEINVPYVAERYAPNGDLEGNTDLQGSDKLLGLHTFKGIAGVLNIAGGIFRRSWLSANNPIMHSVHGNADEVVPYDSGDVKFSGMSSVISLNGSNAMRTYMNNVVIFNKLFTVSGGNHESVNPSTSTYLPAYTDDAALFFAPLMCPSILPVSLQSFTVQANNCTAILRWQTATEAGSSRFDIELSADGTNFHTVGSVQSRNAANGAFYSYNYQSATGTAYFRLKMIDKDGKFTYSAVQQFRSACGSQVQVFPNPAGSQTTVSGLETGMLVRLLNVQGQTLWSQKAGSNNLQLPLTGFTNGLYVVQVQSASGETISNTKLIKK